MNDRLLASFILMGGALFLGWKYYTKHGFLAVNDTQRTESPNGGGSGSGGGPPILPQIPGTPGVPLGPGTVIPPGTPLGHGFWGSGPYNPKAKRGEPGYFNPGPMMSSELNLDGGESMLSRQVG